MGARVGLEPPAHLEPVHHRHHHVEQHDVDMLGGADVQRFRARTGGHDIIVFGGEPGLEQTDIGRDVVDDENARCHWLALANGGRGRSAGPGGRPAAHGQAGPM